MPHTRTSKKPEGQPTRGKTASNRLRRVDNFILLYEPSLLMRTDSLFADSLFVDLGYGFDARTTLESAARFRRVNPNLKILGVEIDKERVEDALPFADDKTFFRLGGFNLPLKEGEHVRLIRAFNVLRQYVEKDFAPAYERLAQYVLPGGLMIEGTSNPFGSIWCANVARKMDASRGSWDMEALVFSTNFRMGFEVEEFQTILPKNLIHHVVQGESIYDFFEAWKRSAKETAAMKTYGAKQWFVVSAEALTQKGYKINLQKKFLSRGYLIWENN
jgi:SAM-dependent methyltransferase